MKSSNLNNYKKMSLEGLRKELDAKKAALYKLKFQKTVEEFKDVIQISKMKRNIAQILTIMTIKEKEAEEISKTANTAE